MFGIVTFRRFAAENLSTGCAYAQMLSNIACFAFLLFGTSNFHFAHVRAVFFYLFVMFHTYHSYFYDVDILPFNSLIVKIFARKAGICIKCFLFSVTRYSTPSSNAVAAIKTS